MMRRRLFLALPLERRFHRSLARYRDSHGYIPYLRWIPLNNLHITVLFLGLVEESAVPEIMERARDVLEHVPPFELTFDRITYAPRHRPADMVWAQFKQNEPFTNLAEQLRQAIVEIVPVPHNLHREQIPHCTLARFAGRVPQRPLIRLRQPEIGGGEPMPVDKVVLFEPQVRSVGPIYRPLQAFEVLSV